MYLKLTNFCYQRVHYAIIISQAAFTHLGFECIEYFLANVKKYTIE